MFHIIKEKANKIQFQKITHKDWTKTKSISRVNKIQMMGALKLEVH